MAHIKDSSKGLRIGILQLIPQLEDAVWGFMRGMEEKSGLTATFDLLEAKGREDRCLPLAQELVGRGCDLLFGCLTPAVKALVQASRNTEIPIVFAPLSHPVLSGILEDEKHPGGRITGASGRLDPQEKVETISLLFPSLDAVQIMANAKDPLSCWEAGKLSRAFTDKKVQVEITKVGSKAPTPARNGLVHLLAFSPELEETMDQWIEPFFRAKAPLVGSSPRAGFMGAVMAVFADHAILGEMAGEMAAHILKGDDPAGMPVRHPPGPSYGFNYHAAGRLGIRIPPGLAQNVDIL